MNKIMWSLLTCIICANSWGGETPIFLVTPNVRPPLPNASPAAPLLVRGQLGTAIYQVINNSNRTLSNIGITNLPRGVKQVFNPGPDYCSTTTALNLPGSLCLIQLQINTAMSGNVSSGPIICADKGARCSQPFSADQLFVQLTPGPIPQTCAGNEANFSYELTQPFDSNTIDPGTIFSWGPARNHLLLSPSNPNLTICTTTDLNNSNALEWMRSRLIYAEDFWVKQKMNYCHHHVTDFYTPLTSYGTPRSAIGTSDGGYCSNATSLSPSNYGQAIRWNYSGTGSETSNNWVNHNRMWYGVDCSDFTSFAYNFAFGIQFNSDTGFQAGQAIDHSQDYLIPNAQDATAADQLQLFSNSNPNSAAGVLVCKDGTTEETTGPNAFCGTGGVSGLCTGTYPSRTCTNGYFSVFNGEYYNPADPSFHKPTAVITPDMLTKLKPGDLLFLAFDPASGKGDGNNTTSIVTHVITWTGKKVGYGPNDVNPSQIAPESICPNNWQPQVGDWTIIDSHYQGADYRDFTPCFYQNNIWGVRRVVGYMQ